VLIIDLSIALIRNEKHSILKKIMNGIRKVLEILSKKVFRK